MRITLKVAAIAFILSGVFICSAPVLAAGTGTVSPTSGNFGTATGSGNSTQKIQQMLKDAEAQMNASGNIGTASDYAAAPSEAPSASNPGTLAESAKTTALSTSTYHQ